MATSALAHSLSRQERDDEVADVSVGSLVFDAVQPGKHGLSTGIGDMLQGGFVEQTMKGATQLTLELLDRDLEAMQSGVFGTKVECVLDGVPFRLTEVGMPQNEQVTALLEHRLIAEMREHKSFLHSQRSKDFTCAMFILGMLKELRDPFVFICPELRRVQPLAPETPEAEPATSSGAHGSLAQAGRGPGLNTNGLTVKGVAVTSAQVKILEIALATAGALGASTLAATALVVALIQENDVSNPDPGTSGDRGALSLIDSTAHGIQAQGGKGTINPYDIAEVCSHFLTAGYAGAGGAIALAKKFPTYTPNKIGSMVQGPEVEYPQKWNAEAAKIVEQFGGSGTSFHGPAGTVTTAGSSSASIKLFEFYRGQPGKPEDTFTCAQRLAAERLWRFFVVGRKSGRQAIYFVDDDDLIKAKPRYTIDPQTHGAQQLSFNVEVGGRTVVIRGKRQPKPSEAELKVRLDRWDAPPGTVIQVNDYGPADGPWIVDSIRRPIFDAAGVVRLRAKQKQLPEARSNTTISTKGKTAKGGNAIPAAAGSIVQKLAREHPEIQQGVREVVAIILAQYPTLTITSTTGGTHAQHSLHYEGRAVDLAGPNMDAIGTWIQQTLGSRLTEGIHNPTLSVKSGQVVPSSFWGSAVWAEHLNHIHVGV